MASILSAGLQLVWVLLTPSPSALYGRSARISVRRIGFAPSHNASKTLLAIGCVPMTSA
jgi:hypothetical protein